MKPTPITDARVFRVLSDLQSGTREVVDADLARDLERDWNGSLIVRELQDTLREAETQETRLIGLLQEAAHALPAGDLRTKIERGISECNGGGGSDG